MALPVSDEPIVWVAPPECAKHPLRAGDTVNIGYGRHVTIERVSWSPSGKTPMASFMYYGRGGGFGPSLYLVGAEHLELADPITRLGAIEL